MITFAPFPSTLDSLTLKRPASPHDITENLQLEQTPVPLRRHQIRNPHFHILVAKPFAGRNFGVGELLEEFRGREAEFHVS